MGEKFTRGETLGEGWGWRRPLVFGGARSVAPGESAAWGEFYGNGAQASDWADLRVTTADRVVMPLKVLVSGASSAKSDFVRVAFATKGDGPYYAWWGNSKATKPAEELEIRRGV